MKQNKIIAVDTNLGTNFLISASDEATVSELRGLIQTEHLSCFPQHGSINVMALTVQYGQRRYHATNCLLLGQIFRKSWNEVHAEVSLKDASASDGSKSTEVESLANGKARNHCAALNDSLLVKCAEIEGLGANRQSSEVLAHSSRPLLCEEIFPENCNEVAPAISNSQNSWINREKFKCPLLSMEAPYTQSFSQLNLAARDRDIVEKGRKCRKRKCLEEQEVLGRKQNQVEVAGQVIVDSDRDKELSPKNRCTSSIEGERNTKEPKGFLLRGHECKQDILCRRGSIEEVADALIAERDKKSRKEKAQPENILSSKTCMGDDSLPKENSKDPLSSEAFLKPADKKSRNRNLQAQNILSRDDSLPKELSKDPSSLEAIVASPRKLKLTSALDELLSNGTEKFQSCQANLDALKSSSSEKEIASFEKKRVSQTSDKTRMERDDSCPKMSSEIRAEGAKEANLNAGVSIDKMDLSMGYPIQLNDHSILLVASLSADVVPETQESQWQSRDGINAEGEEVGLVKRSLDVYDHAVMEPHSDCPRQDLVDSQAIEARGSPLYQDTRNMNSTELNNDVDNASLAILAGKMETSNLKTSVVVDLPSKSFGQERSNPERSNADIETEFLGNCDDKHARQGGNHDNTLVKKKKRRRKRKVSDIDKVSVQEDSRFVTSVSKSPCIKGDIDPQKDAEQDALLTENHEKVRESCHALEMQAQTELEDFDADPGEIQVQNGDVVNVDEGNCRQFSSPCEKSLARTEGLADSSLKNERLQCISGGFKEGCDTAQGDCVKQGEVAQSGIPPKKKKKRRKEPRLPGPDGASGDRFLNMDNGGRCVPFSIKDLPNALRMKAMKEGESNWNNNAQVVGEQVMKKKLKRKTKEMTEKDPNISLVQEQDQNNPTMTHGHRNDTESALNNGLVASSSTRSATKQCFEGGGRANTEQGFDVFEFESSQTGNMPKVSGVDNEVTSHVELEKICSAAVKLVEDDILNTSKVTTRKSSRKAIHPRRLITILSDRLQRNQMSKKNSKQERHQLREKVAGLFNDEEVNLEPLVAEEEAREDSSQIVVENRRVACPQCGRLYTKKTSAYYRHSKKCSGGDY